MRLTIFIKDRQVDLFKDEVIELNSSIADTNDITSINSDYSKTFTVPASENNNKIFKHYYQADIDNTFDSRIKTDGHIDFDGALFRLGGFRLEKVSVRDNKPDAYTISFAGKLPNIKARLGNDLITDLDLSALNFNYTFSNFLAGLTNAVPGSGGNVIFNLFENKKQYLYNAATNENTDKLVNIAYNGGARGLDWNNKKPAVRILKLIEAIEVKYNLKFSRQFFDRADFTELFIYCDKEKNDKDVFSTVINWTNPEFLIFDAYFNDFDDKKIQQLSLNINPSTSYITTPYNVKILNGTSIFLSQNVTGNFFYADRIPNGIYDLSVVISSNDAFSFSGSLVRDEFLASNFGTLNITYSSFASIQFISSVFNISKNLPKLKVTDFLKAIFNMFKLVAIPLPDDTIYMNTIDEFYKEGKLVDLTKYIDFKSYDVQRGTINNEINFRYEEPNTILAKEFLKNTGIAYSDELFELADPYGQPLEGDSLEIKLPFEQPIYERLTGTNIQYALLLDEKLEPTTVKPIIFYNNNINLGLNQISIMNEGVPFSFNNFINTPSQVLNLDVPTNSLNWGVEFSTWNFAAINKTLFSEYWQNYILSVFNIKKREFKFSAILPTHILLSLKLNDILFIRERFYKINDFSVNLNTRETTLNLINTFDANFGIFSTTNKEFITDYTVQALRAYVSNSAIINLSFQDLGFGSAWITAVKNGTFIDITLTQNNTGSFREVFVNANNGAGQQFQIYVRQN